MAIRLGYFVELEKAKNPRILIDAAVYAEKRGFQAVWVTDHFHPWVHTDAGCGFTWSWLAAAAENLKTIPLGPAVTAPILRYHPALVAQAYATLGVMYPNRIFLALGAGEAMNEIPLGYAWPSFRERHERFEEAIQIIRALWAHDFVDFNGKHFRLRKANLYTKPDKPIPLYVAANGPVNAEIAGKYADGFLTMESEDISVYKGKLFPAVARGARSVGRNPDSIAKMLEVNVAYDEDYERALKACKKWGTIMMPVFYKYPIADPREIEAHSRWLDEKELAKIWIISSNPEEHIRRIERYVKEGFTDVHTCNWGYDEYKYIDMYAKHVIPYFQDYG
jgi:coenzyme F420-dependent glucose-6-phosphate dehydrogenase